MNPRFSPKLLQHIEDYNVIAVIVIDHAEDAVPLANALLEGGIRTMELTLRTPTALDALEAIAHNVPEMIAGAGTVLTGNHLRQAMDAGAAFAVAPGLNPQVVCAAHDLRFPFAPGVLTPSEIEQALTLGCEVVKLFPVEAAGGIDYLRSVAAPYAHCNLRFLPLGGISLATLPDYLSEPSVIAPGLSWIAPRPLIRTRSWETISDRAAKAVQLIKEAHAL